MKRILTVLLLAGVVYWLVGLPSQPSGTRAETPPPPNHDPGAPPAPPTQGPAQSSALIMGWSSLNSAGTINSTAGHLKAGTTQGQALAGAVSAGPYDLGIGFWSGAYSDIDEDGVADAADNCPGVFNPFQEDSNVNFVGDACEVPHALKFAVFSPVDMVVTDPNGDSIGIGFNTIGLGSTYDSTTDVNSATLSGPDGDPDDQITILRPFEGDYRVRLIPESGAIDSAKFTLSIRIDGNQQLVPDGYSNASVASIGEAIPSTTTWTATSTITGDANADGKFTSADIIYLVNYVFKNGPPPIIPGHGDTNCNGSVTSADVIRMVNFIFKSGISPCSQTGG
jgi:hypothetical protein